MSEAKVSLSANVWVEVVGLFIVVLDFVNAFGFVPLHVLRPAMRINVSINMLFGIAVCYSRESAPAMPITSGATRLSICLALEMPHQTALIFAWANLVNMHCTLSEVWILSHHRMRTRNAPRLLSARSV
jgi:hypothetical protein